MDTIYLAIILSGCVFVMLYCTMIMLGMRKDIKALTIIQEQVCESILALQDELKVVMMSFRDRNMGLEVVKNDCQKSRNEYEHDVKVSNYVTQVTDVDDQSDFACKTNLLMLGSGGLVRAGHCSVMKISQNYYNSVKKVKLHE
ncbi:hypothetical protein [Candidatus Sneabacter namystus]|uniref:Uncharacterized protein n=1 Tax=Candidatus Sneabacter namystus TaxID=2601646 RepID=A0A5C0UHV4_9RICK|nr:hypothetical protein [Candidatus Sneabacter namystus]QEK39668.1 hypothetical protein FZC37_01835 [Candidatus Sneabacter namystus]